MTAADVNNSDHVGFDDIDGFVAMIPYDPEDANDPTLRYNQMYPGLAGSAVFNGDMNCNDHVGFEDIDLFVDCIPGCCYQTCEEMRGGGEQRSSPAEIAAMLSANVANERQELLYHVVEQAATSLPDRARRAYWRAVYEELPR